MCILDVVSAEKPMRLLFDDYETFSIQIDVPARIGNWLRYVSDFSILEVGVSESDGSLNIIKLIQVPDLVPREVPVVDLTVETGLVQFDVASWKGKRFLDFEVPIELSLTDNAALLMIDKRRSPDRLIKNDNLTIAIHEGYPCWVSLEKLEREEAARIRQAVARDAPAGGFYSLGS